MVAFKSKNEIQGIWKLKITIILISGENVGKYENALLPTIQGKGEFGCQKLSIFLLVNPRSELYSLYSPLLQGKITNFLFTLPQSVPEKLKSFSSIKSLAPESL